MFAPATLWCCDRRPVADGRWNRNDPADDLVAVSVGDYVGVEEVPD
jgi:hypothetical protein